MMSCSVRAELAAVVHSYEAPVFDEALDLAVSHVGALQPHRGGSIRRLEEHIPFA